jgi:hypothetical protein
MVNVNGMNGAVQIGWREMLSTITLPKTRAQYRGKAHGPQNAHPHATKNKKATSKSDGTVPPAISHEFLDIPLIASDKVEYILTLRHSVMLTTSTLVPF